MVERLVLYRFPKDSLLHRFGRLLELGEDAGDIVGGSAFFDCVGELVDFASIHGYSGNIWQAYLAHLLVTSENAYSLGCEIRGDGGDCVSRIAAGDFALLRELFAADLSVLCAEFGFPEEQLLGFSNQNLGGEVFQVRIRDCIMKLAQDLAATESVEMFQQTVSEFYRNFGVGVLGLHKAFRIGEEGEILPVAKISPVCFEDLVGYDMQKQLLCSNTEAFLAGKRANNCLLYGAAGTGKSSSIKALINQYYGQGLRIIEVYKHQFRELSKIIGRIKNRNYRFILYMDDLSFEEFETDYKYLKAVIEGGLEERPRNVLIYATSNRRHLIRESFSDRSDMDDLHRSDTKQEKISLSARFGVKIMYDSPNKKEFNEICLSLAKSYGIEMEEAALLAKANAWEVSHGGRSGRTARQFLDYLAGAGQGGAA